MTVPPIHQLIQDTINAHDVVLFMKGNSKFPMCGFSKLAVQVLTHLDIPFKDMDVMQDPELRQGIKDFTNWPTIPQLYIKGEFIGGSDIVREMYESGELQELLKSKNIMQS